MRRRITLMTTSRNQMRLTTRAMTVTRHPLHRHPQDLFHRRGLPNWSHETITLALQ